MCVFSDCVLDTHKDHFKTQDNRHFAREIGYQVSSRHIGDVEVRFLISATVVQGQEPFKTNLYRELKLIGAPLDSYHN